MKGEVGRQWREYRRFGWSALLAFIFPARCMSCRGLWSPRHTESTGAEASTTPLAPVRNVLCPDCRDACQLLRRPMCSRCGLMFKSRTAVDHRCSDCLAGKGYYGMARSVGVHHEGLKDLVHALKYRGRGDLARPMGRMLRDAFERYWRPDQVDLVIPIPLHAKRLRQRGFNQSALLLRAWQQAAAEAAAGWKPQSNSTVLVRARRTPPQTGLNRRARRRNIRGAFEVVERGGPKGRRIVLLDDVFTTGATVEEAARVLLAAGAASVDVLTFTRTP